jgi:hypothetical protein
MKHPCGNYVLLIVFSSFVSATALAQFDPPVPRTIDLLLARDFQSVLTDVREGRDFHYQMPRRTYPVAEGIFDIRRNGWTRLPAIGIWSVDYTGLINAREQIITDIRQSALADFEKEFLPIYIQSILLPFNAAELPQLREAIRNYLQTYPDSPYSPYVDRVLNLEFKLGKLGTGMGVHLGLNLPFGQVNKTIPATLPIGTTYDLGYGRFVIKGIGAFTPRVRLRQSTTFNGIDYVRDSTFWTTSLHGALGFSVADNDKYKITPFFAAGRTNIHLGKTSDVKYRGNTMFGIDFDWKFSRLRATDHYWAVWNTAVDETTFYLRTRFTYSQLNYSDARFEGSKYSVMVEIGFYERFAKQKRK